MAYTTVPYGASARYGGWTADQVRQALAAVDRAIQEQPAGSGPVLSLTVNGRAMAFDLRGRSLESHKSDLVSALAMVDDTVLSPANVAKARAPQPYG